MNKTTLVILLSIVVAILALAIVRAAVKSGFLAYSANVKFIEVILQEFITSAIGAPIGKFPAGPIEMAEASVDVAAKVPGASVGRVLAIGNTARTLAKDSGLDLHRLGHRKAIAKKLGKMF